MFTKPESYLKRNYLRTDDSKEKNILKNIFEKQVLINLRTYDQTSLILYANDHLNNFVQLYIDNGTQVVYLFNYGNVIHNITVNYAELNSSNPVQIAIVRTSENTTLHVNENNRTLNIGTFLLDMYSNKPWTNPEKGNIIKVSFG